MKKCLSTVVLFAIAYTTSFAQLKVNQSGRIGIGIDPHPNDKLLIKGDLCLTTYPEIPPPLTSWAEMKFKVGNGWPGAEIGATPACKIAFWSSGYGYNNLYASHYYTQSDIAVKTNIEPIENALDKILQLSSYSYNLRSDSLVEEKETFGLLAQDIQSVLPNITDTAKGIILIDYQQIIPLLVEAIKEQQNVIDSLINGGGQSMRIANSQSNEQQTLDSLVHEINEIKNQIATCCNLKQSQISTTNITSNFASTLHQNRPNPFSEKTVIEFEISESFRTAAIMVFDMQGILKKTIPISQTGKGGITINGFELTAGMYLYSLIIDDKEIDTKRMILMN